MHGAAAAQELAYHSNGAGSYAAGTGTARLCAPAAARGVHTSTQHNVLLLWRLAVLVGVALTAGGPSLRFTGTGRRVVSI